MFEWFERQVSNVVDWGSSLFGGGVSEDPYGIQGAIDAGLGPPTPSTVGIPDFGVSSVPDYLPSASGILGLAGTAARSLGTAAAAATQRQGGSVARVPNITLESGSLMSPMAPPRRRESEAPAMAANPFSSRHPLAGWMSSLKD